MWNCKSPMWCTSPNYVWGPSYYVLLCGHIWSTLPLVKGGGEVVPISSLTIRGRTLCALASSLPHLPTHLSTYPPIYLPSHQPTFLSTYTLNLHQGNDDASRGRYCNILSRLFLPTSLLDHVILWLWKTMLQWPNWRYCH